MSSSPCPEREASVPSPALDFRAFFEAAPGALLVALPDDPVFTIVAVTDAFVVVSGAERAYLLGRGLFDCFPDNPELAADNGSQELRSSFRRAITTRAPDRIIQRYDTQRAGAAAGEFHERHWRTINTPLLNVEGSVTYLLHSVEEITENVLAEQRERVALRDLQTSRTRLSAALSFAQLGTFEWDLQTNAVTLDERSRVIFGFQPGEGTRAQEIFDRIHPADFNRVFADAQASRQERSRLETEYRIRMPDSSVRHIVSVSDIAPESDDAARRMFGIFSDVTHQKREQARQTFLLELSDRLRTLADPQAAIAASVHLLGRHLGASRVGYGQVQPDNQTILLESSYVDGVAPILGTYPLDAFGAQSTVLQRQGRTLVQNDVRDDPSNNLAAWAAIETRSFVSVPLIRDGRFRAGFYVNQREVRSWLPAEVSLIEEVAARTWEAVERARAEIALQQSEAKYRTLFESMDQGFCIVELIHNQLRRAVDCRYLAVNPAFEQQTGINNPLGRTFHELVPDIEQFWFDTYGQVILTGQPASFLHHSPALNRWFDAYAFRTGAPEDYQVAVLLRDVTASRAAESEREQLLRQIDTERQLLHQIFTQASAAVIVFRGPDFMVELANPLYQALLFGRELVGRPFVHAMPELGADVWAVFHSVFDTGEPFFATDWYVPYDFDLDGTPEDHWFNVAYSPLREADNSVSGVIAVLIEVTAPVRTRQELERANGELRRANRELEEFAYVASHDLQEPLRMVNIYTQLILKNLAGDPRKLEEYAGFVQQGVKRMDGLIRDLLQYSRVIHNEQAPVETADLSVALQDATTVLQSRIAETAAAITAPVLPTVRGETRQMAQVFQNLLSNALKYRLPDVPPEIRVSAERDGTHWVISVRDNGIGFEPQYAERIFGLFKRLHKDEYPGTGLGLAICQRIVERYGGRLWAEGRPGKGATFSFALPSTDDPE